MDILFESVRRRAIPLTGGVHDYDALYDMIGNARFVLLGEASHGTDDFYRERANITKRLIAEKGFNAIAVEADWPDAYRVNRYVRGMSDDRDPVAALDDFKRFPTWMWRNTVVRDFIGWLREHNDRIGKDEQKTGFYGVDLYSLYTSIQKVLEYLSKVDPDAAKRARYRYSCFDHYAENTQAYGYAATFGITDSCERAVIDQLTELRRNAAAYAKRDGHIPPDELFYAEQNARLVANAEQYYRSMFDNREVSWNLRDEHMADTIEALSVHLRGRAGDAKIVVWEHNSHLGDARATEMSRRGEINVGQLIRERYRDDARLIGFTTHRGTVTAASDWDGPAERKNVRESLENSYERLFHEFDIGNFYMPLGERAVNPILDKRLERAIGVIYRPETERQSHYFQAALPLQFDAVLHFDVTKALEPLERWPIVHTEEPPETYPFAV